VIHRFPAARRGETLNRPATVYLTLVAAATAVATVPLALQVHSAAPDWPAFAFLAFAATISQLFVVKTPSHQSYHMTAVFLVAAALLLPPGLVAAIVVLAHLPEWVRYRYRWYIQGFNICNYVCAAIVSSVAAKWVLGLDAQIHDAVLRFALAGAAASFLFVILNHAILAQMLRLARAKSYRESGLFSFESLSTEFVLAGLGAGVAGFWHLALPLIPFVLATLVLIHRSLSLPNIQAAANVDAKTELFNARFLQTSLADELGRAKRFERPLSIVLADLDLLREVNNTHGHLAGDAVLRGVADVLRSQLRSFDIPSRFGGEEFAILLPETNHQEALATAERIRFAVEETPFVLPRSSGAIHATISLGVASYPAADSPEELIHHADLALYRSKAMGRNRVSGALEVGAAVASPSTDEPVQLAPLVSMPPSAIRRALERLRPIPAPSPAPAVPAAESRSRPRASVVEFVAALAVAAVALLVFSAPKMLDVLRERPLATVSFLAFSIGLQLLSTSAYGRGTEAASVIGILAGGFVLGPAAAVGIALLTAVAQVLKRGGPRYRMVFDLANFSISAGAATWVFAALTGTGYPLAVYFAASLVAGLVYKLLNVGLLCLAMNLDEGTSVVALWRERFSWALIHYLACGPLALAAALAYGKMGLTGLATFAFPAVLLGFSMRQYLERTRTAVLEVQRVNHELAESNERVRQQYNATIAALARAMEAKDDYSGGHIDRVRSIAVAVARKLGFSGEGLQAIEAGALMHDIGKIGIPTQVLTKPGPLTSEEWDVIKGHPVSSDYILSGIDLHPFVRQIVRSSHERIDGAGYPDGLKADEIPLPARIVFVADAFDAITSDRPYSSARGVAEALDELRAHAGTQFCPAVLAALELVWREEPEVLRGPAPSAAAPASEAPAVAPALRVIESTVAA
jgi:diguanylate cyclase (GGDEF)-like protein